MELLGRLTPSLHLSRGNVPERSLLLPDLLTDGLEVGFDLRVEPVPLRLQLLSGLFPRGLPRFGLFLHSGLKLIALFFQVCDQFIRFGFGLRLYLACLGFERRQRGIHLVNALLSPI